MTGRRHLDDAELIERLGVLSREIAWPATPDLAGHVTATLEVAMGRHPGGAIDRLRAAVTGSGRVGGPRGRRVVRLSLVIALIALFAIVVVAGAIVLGVPGVRIELRSSATPAATATPSAVASSPATSAAVGSAPATPGATPPGQDLGPIVSLDAARAEAGFGLLVPTAGGYAEPAEVHLAGRPPFGRVSLRYPDGTLLTEFLGEIQPDAFDKIVGGGTTVAPARVGASDGWWISGAPHTLGLMFRDPDGQVRWQEVTVEGNVLLWQAGDVTLRLETPLDRAAAIAVGRSVR